MENQRSDSLICCTGFYGRLVIDKNSFNMMLSTIFGDIDRSAYEHHNIKYFPDKDRLIIHHSHFTNNLALTLSVAVGIKNGLKKLN